jgi:hypothetical protein
LASKQIEPQLASFLVRWQDLARELTGGFELQADDYTIETVLAEGRRFMVPLYQRKYQWADVRLVPFWDDVEAKAAEVLGGDSRFQHYMGALILAPLGEGSQIGVTPKVQVVDGQQRLTTFQLFLAALREVARSHDCTGIIEQVNGYLFNQPRSKDTDPLVRFKLTPTPSDREIFHDILDSEYLEVWAKYQRYYWGGGVPKNTPFRALRAYDLFRKWVNEFALNGPNDSEPDTDDEQVEAGDEVVTPEVIEERLDALLSAVLSQMKLVVITLGESDDAQVIFETLNSKGEPLLAMDLVRNNIFHRAEKQSTATEELYKELWDPFDAPWWREDAPNARPRRPRIDHFLAHVLAAETGASIAMRELYAEYRAFAVPKGRPRFPDVEDELKVLQRHSPVYETLEGRKGDNPTMSWLGRKLATWQVTTAYPVALQIAAANLPEEEQDRIARLIYSYIVRRAICDLTNKNLNKLFQAVSQRFFEDGPSYENLSDFFLTRSGESSRFPGDDEFRRGILQKPVYQLAPGDRNKDILWELELASRSKFAEKVARPDGLWTEHVLPVSWNEDWPFVDGEFTPRGHGHQKAQDRDRLLHTLGNLTLITSTLNISSGNKGFVQKREKFDEHTSLFLNKWFAKREAWTEADILERGEQMADKALVIWPGLDEQLTKP